MDIFEGLKKNPIFAMSLTSKELFHSNFWGWLFERNTAYIKVFFDDNISPDDYKVTREEGNKGNKRDITVWTKSHSKAYVIENKFKSVPKADQLNRYQNALGDAFAKGVITGIVPPAFTLKDWKFMSYSEIGNAIKEIASQVEKDGFEKQLIIEYADMLLALTDCLKNALDNTLGKWQLKSFEDFEQIRMDDILKKLKASELEDYLRKELQSTVSGTAGKNGQFSLFIDDSFSHKHPVVNIQYVQENNIIGIQIENYQYRRCVQSKASNDAEKEALFKQYQDLGWFEEYVPKKDRTIMGKETSLKVRYGKYSPDFLYQYWDLKEGTSFADIKEYVEKDMQFAAEILNKIT